MPADKLCPDNFREIREALVVQDLIIVFSALLTKLLISPEFMSVCVFVLQLLQT